MSVLAHRKELALGSFELLGINLIILSQYLKGVMTPYKNMF